jgi:hypothetical protein
VVAQPASASAAASDETRVRRIMASILFKRGM